MTSCRDCSKPIGYISRRYVCPGCNGGPLCWYCINNAAITNHATLTSITDTAIIKSFCLKCFWTVTSLDPTQCVDIMGPAAGEGVSVLLIHGGGGCRKMFTPHARELALLGFRCILVDLPAHGARVREPITIDTACAVIADAVAKYAAPYQGVRPIVVGGSLGGYLAMEFCGRHPDVFSGAAVLMACQTVGAGAGVKARAGLSMMKAMSAVMSNQAFLGFMLSTYKKNAHLDFRMVHEATLATSMFFQRGSEQVAVLRSTDSVRQMSRYRGHVFYANGALDHADMKTTLVAVSTANNAHVKEVTYPDVDHFFSHDTRSYRPFMADLTAFLEGIVREGDVA